MSQKENEIKKLCTDYIFNETKAAFMLLILSHAEELLKEDVKAFDMPADLTNIKNEVKRYLSNIEGILNSSAETREAALEECVELKNRLVEIYKSIYSYYVQWNVTATPIGDENALRKYTQSDAFGKKIDYNRFYQDCFEYLDLSDSLFTQKTRIGKLLKCLPLKMTKDKYFDLVERSLHLAFGGESEKSIELSLDTLINTCAPGAKADYGKYFPEIAELIETKAKIKASNLSDEDLDNAYTDLTAGFEMLQDIEEACQDIFNDVNSLIIIFFAGFTFDDLTEDNPEYKDVYYKCVEIISSNDSTEAAIFAEPLRDLAESYAEKLIDRTNEINGKEMDFFEKYGKVEIENEDVRKLAASETFIRSCFYGDLNAEIFNFNLDEDLPPASEEFKKKAFGEFLTTVRDQFSALPNAVRKVSMLSLLGSLPVDMSPVETVTFIKDTLESESKLEGKLLIMDKTGMVLTEDGFVEDHHHHDCGCGHHHHDHDCDCGCGHDHHHHHHDCDCGCNHDHHHHHHDCDCDHC